MIGKQIGSYKITRLIGEGGMGTVYEGRHQYIDRKVAVKALNINLINNESIKARFKNEALALSRLKHPNIVSLYDYIETRDNAYLVMEYVEGRELGKMIQKETGPILAERAVKLMAQILDAVGYAHNMNVVHRDLKPSNIMITNDDVVKVLDFGIARLTGDKDISMTSTGTRMGTVLYMSPEQVRGEKVDHQTDIYSLGIILFEMLTGRCPYDANKESEFDIQNKIVNQPIPTMQSFYPPVKQNYQTVINQAVAKKKVDRFESCEKFSEVILKYTFNNVSNYNHNNITKKQSIEHNEVSNKVFWQFTLYIILIIVALIIFVRLF